MQELGTVVIMSIAALVAGLLLIWAGRMLFKGSSALPPLNLVDLLCWLTIPGIILVVIICATLCVVFKPSS